LSSASGPSGVTPSVSFSMSRRRRTLRAARPRDARPVERRSEPPRERSLRISLRSETLSTLCSPPVAGFGPVSGALASDEAVTRAVSQGFCCVNRPLVPLSRFRSSLACISTYAEPLTERAAHRAEAPEHQDTHLSAHRRAGPSTLARAVHSARGLVPPPSEDGSDSRSPLRDHAPAPSSSPRNPRRLGLPPHPRGDQDPSLHRLSPASPGTRCLRPPTR
jgi:hypothetical protein